MDVTESYSNLKLESNERVIEIPVAGLTKGLIGILTVPENPGHHLAILAHGIGGHKNYTFLKLSAQELAVRNGSYSFRFDFRGCGDSGDDCSEDGRFIHRDLEDLDLVIQFWAGQESNQFIRRRVYVNTLIGHSRGVVPIFKWLVLQWKKYLSGEPAILVPNIVNVSGRFYGPGVVEWARRTIAGWPELGGFTLDVYKQGKHGHKHVVPVAETEDTGKQIYEGEWDLGVLNDLQYYNVLTIFGLKDTKVDVEDAALFANKLGKIHRLVLIKDADHNFYSTGENMRSLPTNSRGLVNHNHEVSRHILDWLLQYLEHFSDSSATVSRVARWKAVEGVNNFRDIGGYRSVYGVVRPSYIFRSANVARITTNGLKKLQDLGITRVFDVRSESEIEASPFPQTTAREFGVTYQHTPMFAKSNLAPEAIFLRYENLLSSIDTIPDVYIDFLRTGQDCFRAIFSFILRSNERFLFHCAAGKDRTGVIAMLILLICDVEPRTVAREYSLTTIGLKPELPSIRESFAAQVDKFSQKFLQHSGHTAVSPERTRKYINEYLGKGQKNYDVEIDGFNNLTSSTYETMLTTIDRFDKEFGGVRKYVLSLGFTDGQYAEIRKKLIVEQAVL